MDIFENSQQKAIPYRRIKLDYIPCDEDDDRVYRIKRVIFSQLSDGDQAVLLLYADTGSVRKVGKQLGCSHTTILRQIHRIQKEIKKHLKHYDIH